MLQAPQMLWERIYSSKSRMQNKRRKRCDERADKREQIENDNDGHEEKDRDSHHEGLASDEQFAFAWSFLLCEHRFVPLECSTMQLLIR